MIYHGATKYGYGCRCDVCKEAKRSDYRQLWAKRRAWLDAFKQQPCMDCDGTFSAECMDLDHREGEGKDFEIGARIITKAWAKVLTEIEKCDLVCANCHRIRTKKRREQSG